MSIRRARPAALPLWPVPLLALLAACGGGETAPEDGGGPVAEPGRAPRWEVVESLRRDLESPRHAADGGGLAWLEEPAPARVSTAGRWTIAYEAGPEGIAAGGMLYLQVSPFWGWSTPQVEAPEEPGYCEVSTAAAGVELVPRTLDRQLLGIAVAGRGLAVGEQVRIVYGAGPAGAVADRFAERGSRFWIAVDGDGDGVRALIGESPGVDVLPGPAARLVVTLPSTARPGETVPLTVAVLDASGNAGVPFAGEIRLRRLGEEAVAEPPPSLRFAAEDGGRRTVELAIAEPGVLRLAAAGPEGLAGQSNPLQAAERAPKILWGDLQNHSGWSDGSGHPEDLLLYARDVAALDVVALTDHDHWGMRFLDRTPAMWEETLELCRRYYEPGRFVTVPGYEWTSWIHGHRHVLFFAGGGEVASSMDPATETPQQLWAALAGRRAMTIAHHSAGGPIAVDWSIAPDPELEPVTEIVSVHGSSEAADSPSRIYRSVPGNFVRDALDRGYRFGFLGSSDGHDGHPGLAHLASPTGGLAAILAEEATREAVYEALRQRHVYATSGPRILLRVSYGGHRMGSEVPLSAAGRPVPGTAVPGIPAHTLVVQALAPGAIDAVEVVRPGSVESVSCGGERRCAFALEIPEPPPGGYLYVRLVQQDGALAWSSPFYFVASSQTEND